MREVFHFEGITAEMNHHVATVLANVIRARIRRGLDVADGPAPPLTKKYLRAKLGRDREPIRDWEWRGALRGIRALHGESNEQIVVGITNATALRIASFQQARWPQFGVSPSDRRKLIATLNHFRLQIARGEDPT